MTNEDLILQRLETIERYSLLAAKNVLTIDDVTVLTGLSKFYIYKLISQREIPYFKPAGKNVYFDRTEIENWMRRNRHNTHAEAEQAAAAYIVNNQ
jgi:excisionase family DNA binding protein